jgi:hypothetical protein
MLTSCVKVNNTSQTASPTTNVDRTASGTPGSHCTKNCTLINDCGNPNPSICGNGIVEVGEECDDGYKNGDSSSNCTTDCKICNKEPPRCGDGHIDPGEECDE